MGRKTGERRMENDDKEEKEMGAGAKTEKNNERGRKKGTKNGWKIERSERRRGLRDEKGREKRS